MRIAFYGSSLVSSYWNGAATYYRGLLRELAARGHTITFYEPDAYERQDHRDIADPPWAQVLVYPATLPGVALALRLGRDADLVIKASGVGVFDEWLEAHVLDLAAPNRLVAFWDVDAPATLERVRSDGRDPFRLLIPRYDVIFTYGGGHTVVEEYTALGAQLCAPIYNALDPTTHHPDAPDPRFRATLGFLGNRLPDREARVDEFFFKPARLRPQDRFVLGGAGWNSRNLPANVTWVGHVPTALHNSFNASVLAVLNVHRDSMARVGSSPATRVFEAAGAGACLISDACEGLDSFLTPGREILLARDGGDVAQLLEDLTPARAVKIGAAARARVLAKHTYAHRAEAVDRVLAELTQPDPAAQAEAAL